jgi:hypothetical protein
MVPKKRVKCGDVRARAVEASGKMLSESAAMLVCFLLLVGSLTIGLLVVSAKEARAIALNAWATAPTRVALKWKIDNPGSFTNIRIFRATAARPRDFCLVASVAGGETGFVDRGLAPGNVYLYQLRMVQEGGVLMPTPSNTASVSLRSANDSPPGEPPAPKPPPAVTPVS